MPEPSSGSSQIHKSSASLGFGSAKLTTLYAFPNTADGQNPQTPFASDAQGNLYGTTQQGGGYSSVVGVLFELTPGTSGYSEKVLYDFTSSGPLGKPRGPVSADADGNLWGQSSLGIYEFVKGSSGWTGTLVSSCVGSGPLTIVADSVYAACSQSSVVMLSKGSSGYSQTTLYQWPSHRSYAVIPNGGLKVTRAGNVFGSASDATASCCGAPGPTYELKKTSTGYTYTRFFSTPTAFGPVFDSSWNIYEVGFFPGPDGYGSFYKAIKRSGFHYTVTQPYQMTNNPYGSPVLTASGTIYYADENTIVELAPSGTGYTHSVIYTFNNHGTVNQLTMDSAGNLYGATTAGGGGQCRGGMGCGVYFKLTP